jgi:hypothetical protein
VGNHLKDLMYHNFILNQIKDSLVIKEYSRDDKGSFIGGAIRCASRVKAEHYGLTIESIKGKTDFDLMPIEQAQKALGDDIWVMSHNKSIENMDEVVTYPNGKTVRKSTTKSPLVFQNGEIVGVICISRIISESEE